MRSVPLAVVAAALVLSPAAATGHAAERVAPAVAEPAAPAVGDVVLVGGDSPTDALVAGPTGRVVLFTAGGRLPRATRDFFAAHPVRRVTVFGGERAVSASVVAEVIEAVSR